MEVRLLKDRLIMVLTENAMLKRENQKLKNRVERVEKMEVFKLLALGEDNTKYVDACNELEEDIKKSLKDFNKKMKNI